MIFDPSMASTFLFYRDHTYDQPIGAPKMEIRGQNYPMMRHQSTTITNRGLSLCRNVIEFVAILFAWSIARIFRCGKLGKMNYSQLVAKYWTS